MTSTPHRFIALLVLIASTATLAGCKPMSPRPAVAKPVTETEDAHSAARDPSKDPAPGDPEWNSSSTLGKARDAAVRTKAKSDAYQREVSKQADEVFKNP